eukprot:1121382-Pleurochrysis_carterae.AAC.1
MLQRDRQRWVVGDATRRDALDGFAAASQAPPSSQRTAPSAHPSDPLASSAICEHAICRARAGAGTCGQVP